MSRLATIAILGASALSYAWFAQRASKNKREEKQQEVEEDDQKETQKDQLVRVQSCSPHIAPAESNLYDVLEVAPTASFEEIGVAYRKLARVLHPDKNPSPWAKMDFQRIGEAYEHLIDPEKRREYDSFLEEFNEEIQYELHSRATSVFGVHILDLICASSMVSGYCCMCKNTSKSIGWWVDCSLLVCIFLRVRWIHPPRVSDTLRTATRISILGKVLAGIILFI